MRWIVKTEEAWLRPRPGTAASDAALLHAVQNGSDDAAHDPGLRRLCAPLGWHVLLKFVGQLRDRQCLQPDTPRPSEGCEEDTVATKNHIANPWDAHDLKVHPCVERSDMTWMYSQ